MKKARVASCAWVGYVVLVVLVAGMVAVSGAWAQAPAPAAAPAAKAAAPSTVVPVGRDQEGWKNRFALLNERVKPGDAQLIFIGDSITEGWEGAGKDVWEKYYAPRKAVNLGISGDQTQHVLYRLDNGNLNGIKPKLAVIMIGTNNVGANTAEEIAEGDIAIVKKLQAKLPEMKILLLAIFPRSEKPDEARAKLAKASELASKVADNKKVFFLDIGKNFTQPDGSLSKDIMPDFLHLSSKGYEIWATSIEAKVAELMGEKKK